MGEFYNKERSPCLGCKDREVGCHGRCEIYKAWTERHEEYLKRVREQKQTDSDFIAVRVEHRGRKKRHDR
jgi:hypothetical protein